MRWYLTGRVSVEGNGRVFDEAAFSGSQAVLVLARIAVEHDRAVSRAQLGDMLWPLGPPPRWEANLRSIVSRLRSRLRGLDAADRIRTVDDGYQLRLAHDDWVDFDEATTSTHLAESLLTVDQEKAAATAWVAEAITRRGFLDHGAGPWIDEQRHRLRVLRMRALVTLSEALSGLGNHDEAIRYAELVISFDPFRERSHRRLIAAHSAAGDRASAARAFRDCETLLKSELGIPPHPTTIAAYQNAIGV